MNNLLANEKTILSVKDTDQVIFTEEKSLMEFLNSVKKNTEVRNVPLNLLCPKGAEFELLLDMSDFSRARVGALDVPDINDKAVMSCLEDHESQLFVTIPGANKWHWVPLRGISYESLLERAELSCKALKRTADSARWFAVPAKERGEVIDLFLQSSKPAGGKGVSGPRTCKCVVVNRKVNYFGSASYAYVADCDAYSTTKKILGKEFPKVALEKGWWSYEITTLDLRMNDSIRDDSLLETLNNAEEKYSSAFYGVRVINSLNGKSALKAIPYVSIDGKKIAIDTGCKAKAIHMGSSAILERFQDSLEELSEKAFEEIDEIIEGLGNVEIKDVSFVVSQMADHIPELHGIQSAIKHGTAIDCLLEAVKDQAEELVTARYLLYLDYQKIEEGSFDWSSFKK